MPLQRQIRRVDLQVEAVADDGLVLDAQGGGDRLEIGLEARVVLVLHDRCQDARRCRGKERRRRALPLGRIGLLEGGALGIELGLADVADRADAFGQMGDVAHRLAGGDHARALLLELGVGLDVGERSPAALPADAAQAVAQVKNEGLALLLAVGDDVDAGLALLADHPSDGLPSRSGQHAFIDRLAVRPAHVEAGQLGRPRQAARVGRQDSRAALCHARPTSPGVSLAPI